MVVDEMMCHKKSELKHNVNAVPGTNGPRLGLFTAHEASGNRVLFGGVQVKENSFDLILRCQARLRTY